MDVKLQEELTAKEKKHKKQLVSYKASKAVENFGQRSFWLFYNNIDNDTEYRWLWILLLSLGRLIIRIIPFVFVYLVVLTIFNAETHIIIAVIVYVAMYLAVFGCGHILRNKFEIKLNNLEEECGNEREKYLLELFLENKIRRSTYYDEIVFENGITVDNNGNITAEAPRQNVDFKLYSLKNHLDFNQYYDKTLMLPNNKQTMEKNIASVEFNKKFSIVIKKSAERECMKYFSPTLQNQMVKSTVLPTCYNIKISNQQFCAQTENTVERPSPIDLFTFKSVMSYFKDDEEYCSKFSSIAQKIHTDLSRIDF